MKGHCPCWAGHSSTDKWRKYTDTQHWKGWLTHTSESGVACKSITERSLSLQYPFKDPQTQFLVSGLTEVRFLLAHPSFSNPKGPFKVLPHLSITFFLGQSDLHAVHTRSCYPTSGAFQATGMVHRDVRCSVHSSPLLSKYVGKVQSGLQLKPCFAGWGNRPSNLWHVYTSIHTTTVTDCIVKMKII